jgi:hypothetical protein
MPKAIASQPESNPEARRSIANRSVAAQPRPDGKDWKQTLQEKFRQMSDRIKLWIDDLGKQAEEAEEQTKEFVEQLREKAPTGNADLLDVRE